MTLILIEPYDFNSCSLSHRLMMGHSKLHMNEAVLAMVEFEDDAIQVDMAVVAKGLGVEPPLVQEGMREGRITSLYERGVDDDEGRHRVTFFSGSRRFRLVVDNGGNVLQRSVLDFGDRGLPASARKSGI